MVTAAFLASRVLGWLRVIVLGNLFGSPDTIAEHYDPQPAEDARGEEGAGDDEAGAGEGSAAHEVPASSSVVSSVGSSSERARGWAAR